MPCKTDSHAPAVVLFDIDGTLIRRAGPHHREALLEAVRRVTGIRGSLDGIPVQGMLDRKILEAILLGAGASPAVVRRGMPAMVVAAQSYYVRNAPASLERRVCPGVRGFLHRLASRRVPAGLVSGNLARIGWKKMERAGLRHHFRFGAFAERAPERAGLVRIALRHARARGWIGPATRLWLVGDHPNDVLAARANGIGSLAVATGLSSRQELASHSPDLLLDDLRLVKLEMLFEA